MTNADVARIINSDEVQSVVNPAREAPMLTTFSKKKNALKNRKEMAKLNPGSLTKVASRKRALEPGTKEHGTAQKKKAKTVAEAKKHHKGSKTFYSSMMKAFEAAAAKKGEETAKDDEEE